MPGCRIAALILLAVSLPAAAAQWRVATTENFRIYSTGSEKRLTETARLLEDYRDLLQGITNATKPVEAAPRLDIMLVGDMAEAVPFGKIADNIAGLYAATADRIIAYADTNTDLGQVVLLHEYAHHFMLGSTAAAYPAWYIEGFAEYFSTAQFRPDSIQVGNADRNRSYALVAATWLPLETILAKRSPTNAEDAALYYAQSWLMTHYLFRAPGMAEKLGAYLTAVNRGDDSISAFKAHVAADLPDFQRKLHAYLTGSKITLSRFQRSPPEKLAVAVTTLPASADPMLRYLIALEQGVAKADAPKALAKINVAAAQFPGDDLALRTLALAELRLGDAATGKARIDSLLIAHPDDATLLRWRAEAERPLASGATPQSKTIARQLLVKSFKADSSDWRTMFDYVQLAQPWRGPLNPQTLEVAMRAYELAPQVAELAITTAAALAQAGRKDEAAIVLGPIAHNPHGGGAAEYASKMIERLRSGGSIAPPAPPPANPVPETK